MQPGHLKARPTAALEENVEAIKAWARESQSGTRRHLNLQIDLVAKREVTAVLQLLHDIARHLEVDTTVTPEQLRDLAKNTDVRRLTDRMEDITEPPPRALPPASAMGT